jgi:CBS domain
MSPRAAWRLEAAGFGPVYDDMAGKMDWLAADLPFEGTAQFVGMFTRRDVATAGEHTPASEALRLLEAQGFGPVLVLNEAGVVMGAAYRDRLEAAAGQADAGTVMRFGVSTVRPSEDAAALVHRMRDRGTTRVVVTRSDGTLIGLFFAADVNLCCPSAGARGHDAVARAFRGDFVEGRGFGQLAARWGAVRGRAGMRTRSTVSAG